MTIYKKVIRVKKNLYKELYIKHQLLTSDVDIKIKAGLRS